MVDDRDIVEAELHHIFLHRLAVALLVLHGDDRAFAAHHGRFDRDGFAGDDTEILALVDLHLGEQHRADLRTHVFYGAGGKILIVHAELDRASGVRIEDDHARGCVDAAVDHRRDLVPLDGTGRLGTFIVDDLALAEAHIPHLVENILIPRLGEDQHAAVRLHGGDQILVFPGDVEDLHMLEIDVGILRKIL